MFGYVLINKPELKIKDFEMYRSYYCGLCHTLGERHGLKGRVTLTYDMTFLLMLLSDLYEAEERVTESRCLMHPVQKHKARQSEITEYCADMEVLLAYHKCLDDWNDDRKISKKALASGLSGPCKRITAQYSEKAAFIESKLKELTDLENAGEKSIDRTAKLFGEIMASVFVYKDDQWKNDLYKVGFYLGKYIYLLDAYEDIEEDMKNGSYNPFKTIYNNEDFENQVLNLLLMMIGECTDAFERLPVVENVEIMRNILYSGVWGKFGETKAKNQVKEKKKE